MSLRVRLSIFFTLLICVVIVVTNVVVFGALRNFLESKIREDLDFYYNQIIRTQNTITIQIGRIPDLLQRTIAWDLYPDLYGQLDIFFQSPYSLARSLKSDQWQDLYRLKPEPAEFSESIAKNKNNLTGQVAALQFSQQDYQKLIDDLHSTADTQPKGMYTYINYQPSPNESYPLLVYTNVVVFSPVGLSEQVGVLHLAKDLTSVYTTLGALQKLLVTVSLAVILIVAIGSYVVADQVLTGLRILRRATANITDKNLALRVPEPKTRDEVAGLARTINVVLGRLQRSFENERRFTSDASHELRTPVTAIAGHASYLLRRTSPTPQQVESLNIIKNEAERLSGLIQSLLELTRADAGHIPLQLQPILAQAFLEDISREMQPISQEQDAKIKVQGEEIIFAADPNKLRQVAINLVFNALKAGAKEVVLSSKKDDQKVLLSIADNGPGIPEEHLPKLFDRFYRVHESRARDAGGSGLGLAIVKTIIDAHEGKVWIESTVGKGTTVHVELPYKEIQAEDF